MKKALSVVNAFILVLLIAWNYYSNTGAINGETAGSLSDQYSSLFVPADYAFAIWGLIYLGLAASAGYFLFLAFGDKEHSECVTQAAPGLIIANLANGAWLWFWLNEQILNSVLMLSVVLVALIATIVRLNMEKWDAPVKYMALVWWPIDLYIGWISVALIANLAAYLNSIGFAPFFSEEIWTVILISLAVLLNAFMIFNRNMREFAAVGIWALVAIAVRHWMEIPLVGVSAAIGAIVLAILSAHHANRNKASLPHKKVERGEV
ncbi:MAG: tryptophan-rich sensory protein [Cryomorphaceae bacterium]